MFFAAVDLTRRKSHERTKSLRVDLVQCSVGVFDLHLQVGSTFSRQTARCRSPFGLQHIKALGRKALLHPPKKHPLKVWESGFNPHMWGFPKFSEELLLAGATVVFVPEP